MQTNTSHIISDPLHNEDFTHSPWIFLEMVATEKNLICSLYEMPKQSAAGCQPVCVCVFQDSDGLKWEMLVTFVENSSNWPAILEEMPRDRGELLS